MSARDLYHDAVRQALIREGWTITHDPYPLLWGDQSMSIDLGAERVIGAENNGRKIAVEVKSFLKESRISDFYEAIGQYSVYEEALIDKESERTLYLAIPVNPYDDLFVKKSIGTIFRQRHPFNMMVFNPETSEVVSWLPLP